MTTTVAQNVFPPPPPPGGQPSLAISIGKMRLQNPLMTASGTCGYANEYGDFTDMTRLGAFVTKAISKTPRKGNESYRVVETRAGMLNAIGLANIGLEVFLRDKIPVLRKIAAAGVPVIVNVPGWTTEDYVEVSAALDQEETVAGIELNVSCPNVKNGLSFGTDPARLFELVSAVKKVVTRCELIVKLSPNVADVAVTAKAAVEGGATCLSLVNTFTAMVVDIEKQRPMLANGTGGLSGPAIKPIAVFMTHRVYTEVAKKHGIPIIGMGGIQRWQDAVEFLLAGATGLAVGTALFLDPNIPVQIVEGLQGYLKRIGKSDVNEIIGALMAPAPHEQKGIVAVLSYNTKSFEHLEQPVCRRGFLLLARDGMTLPPRCVCCNAVVDEPPARARFAWHDPMLFIILAAMPLIYPIVRLFVVKRGTLYLCICRRDRDLMRSQSQARAGVVAIGVLLVIASLAALVASQNFALYMAIFMLGYGAIAAGVAYPILTRRVRPYCIGAGVIQLQGVHHAFLNELPDISPPQALVQSKSAAP